MMIAKRVFNRILREFATWCHQGGPKRRLVYYRLFSNGFKREQFAVGEGIAKYWKTVGTGKEFYLLRRNIHMLEKGLTMQPRRDIFALKYIGETVERFCAISMDTESSAWLNTEEYRWMRSVLTEYFEATRSSNTPTIQRLEERFISSQVALPQLESHLGPMPPEVGASSVSIDALINFTSKRRSVRWFDDRIPPRSQVDKAVEVAIQAPTACNRQPYRFEIFDDTESISHISSIPGGTAGYSHQIPGLVVVVGDLSAFFDERDRHLIYIDSCLASMSLILGLEAQGLGSCIINWPDLADKERAMKELLGLEDYERIIMLIAYGYPKADGLAPYSAKRHLNQARLFRDIQPAR